MVSFFKERGKEHQKNMILERNTPPLHRQLFDSFFGRVGGGGGDTMSAFRPHELPLSGCTWKGYSKNGCIDVVFTERRVW
jgi:hypothetical protein